MRRKKKNNVNMNVKCGGGNCGGCMGCFYFLGFLGAAIYNVSVATGFWVGVWGVIKALVWPAILVFELFKYIGI